MDPLIFDIVRGSFVDGPGIRTVVFLQGCPLRCAWCHNPESQHSDPQLTQARRYSVDELCEIILRDLSYYSFSGGGVTFSGGEPLAQIESLIPVCRILKKNGVSVAFQTSGFFSFEDFSRELMLYTDILLFDLKIMDERKSIAAIGAGSRKIIENLRRLHAAGKKIIIRIPLIPGLTVTNENLSQISSLLIDLNIAEFEMIPYNPSFATKLAKAGRTSRLVLPAEPLSLEQEQYYRNLLSETITLMRRKSTILTLTGG